MLSTNVKCNIELQAFTELWPDDGKILMYLMLDKMVPMEKYYTAFRIVH